MNNNMNMDKTYNPKDIENKIYEEWEKSGAFIAKIDKNKKPFTIVMPPPNITGQLHMGHAMDSLLQDAPIRYHRMKGDPTLWLPGTDHASIATEVKIVEKLALDGVTKEDIGREEFLKKAWEWKEEYGGIINSQQRKLGVSCDWSRERFTMDEGCSKAVTEVFVNLYNKGLIYKGDRMINWCPVCKTALSDAEVEYEEQNSNLWYIKYPSEDGIDGIIVATTRPETMLGDTGVAVNPNDSRYKKFIGKNVILPLMNRPIPVVADDYVDMDFGTGAVKMTPAHDPNDFEIAQRHNLEILRINNDDGSMNENAGEYKGLSAIECRKKVVEDLKKLGLLVKIEDHNHNVGTCYRCSTTVEPIVSSQWFVKMDALAKPAIEVVKNGETVFIPERFSKTYFNWMENIRDWCISRQLWWGHRIPAWYCEDCSEINVSKTTPKECSKCKSKNLKQDEDVLDTWFSSALWPFSTLGWPEKTEDLDYFYPTSLLVTGYDIIFFWVARMIFSGIENMGETPFAKVLIHGLVRDSQGRKMSKSLGNGIDPLDIIENYGADALRFSLVMGISPGNDTRFSNEKVESARNFANKVWNASRFVLMNVDKPYVLKPENFNLADKWIVNQLSEAILDVSNNMENGEFGLAAQRVYDFIWNEFCDWYIEFSKASLFSDDINEQENIKAVLLYILTNSLKLLHPFMPFITEAIYKNIPGTSGFIMLSNWPQNEYYDLFKNEAQNMNVVMEIIKTIRNLRVEMDVPHNKNIRVFLKIKSNWKDKLSSSLIYIKSLIRVSEITLVDYSNSIPEKTVSSIFQAGEILIPMGDLVDYDKELIRLQKEFEKIKSEIHRAEGKLNNKGFIKKAPETLVEEEKKKLLKYQNMLLDISDRINQVKEEI